MTAIWTTPKPNNQSSTNIKINKYCEIAEIILTKYYGSYANLIFDQNNFKNLNYIFLDTGDDDVIIMIWTGEPVMTSSF